MRLQPSFATSLTVYELVGSEENVCELAQACVAGSHRVKLVGDSGGSAVKSKGVLLFDTSSLAIVMYPGATTTPTCSWLSRFPIEPVSSLISRSWKEEPDAKCAPCASYPSLNAFHKLVLARCPPTQIATKVSGAGVVNETFICV